MIDIVICVLVILLLIIGLGFLIYKLVCGNKHEEIQETEGKLKGGATGIIARLNDNGEYEFIIITTIEIYVILKPDGTIIIKIGYWSCDKTGFKYHEHEIEVDMMNNATAEFCSHFKHMKGSCLNKNEEYIIGHTCLYCLFNDGFTDYRELGNEILKQGSAAIAGIIEIIGHLVSLELLYELCGDNVVITSDKQHKEFLNSGANLFTFDDVIKILKIKSVGGSSELRNIMSFGKFAVSLEYHIGKTNIKNLSVKDIVTRLAYRIRDVFIALFINGDPDVNFNLFGTTFSVTKEDFQDYTDKYGVFNFYELIEGALNENGHKMPNFYMSDIIVKQHQSGQPIENIPTSKEYLIFKPIYSIEKIMTYDSGDIIKEDNGIPIFQDGDNITQLGEQYEDIIGSFGEYSNRIETIRECLEDPNFVNYINYLQVSKDATNLIIDIHNIIDFFAGNLVPINFLTICLEYSLEDNFEHSFLQMDSYINLARRLSSFICKLINHRGIGTLEDKLSYFPDMTETVVNIESTDYEMKYNLIMTFLKILNTDIIVNDISDAEVKGNIIGFTDAFFEEFNGKISEKSEELEDIAIIFKNRVEFLHHYINSYITCLNPELRAFMGTVFEEYYANDEEGGMLDECYSIINAINTGSGIMESYAESGDVIGFIGNVIDVERDPVKYQFIESYIDIIQEYDDDGLFIDKLNVLQEIFDMIIEVEDNNFNEFKENIENALCILDMYREIVLLIDEEDSFGYGDKVDEILESSMGQIEDNDVLVINSQLMFTMYGLLNFADEVNGLDLSNTIEIFHNSIEQAEASGDIDTFNYIRQIMDAISMAIEVSDLKDGYVTETFGEINYDTLTDIIMGNLTALITTEGENIQTGAEIVIHIVNIIISHISELCIYQALRNESYADYIDIITSTVNVIMASGVIALDDKNKYLQSMDIILQVIYRLMNGLHNNPRDFYSIITSEATDWIADILQNSTHFKSVNTQMGNFGNVTADFYSIITNDTNQNTTNWIETLSNEPTHFKSINTQLENLGNLGDVTAEFNDKSIEFINYITEQLAINAVINSS